MAQFTVIKGQKDTQSVVQRRHVLIQEHFQNLDDGRDNTDVGNQT